MQMRHQPKHGGPIYLSKIKIENSRFKCDPGHISNLKIKLAKNSGDFLRNLPLFLRWSILAEWTGNSLYIYRLIRQ